MEWWQGALLILGFVGAGLLAGFGVGGLIIHLRKKRRREVLPVEKVSPIQYKSPGSDLVAELKYDLEIASQRWAGELLPFQTSVWDTDHSRFIEVSPGVREDLEQAYIDMRLANNIVWLSKELGRKTGDMDKSYRKLCSQIAARLEKTAVTQRPLARKA